MKKLLLLALPVVVACSPDVLRASWEAPSPSRTPPAKPVRGVATQALYGGSATLVEGYDFGPRYGEVDPEIFSQTLDADEHPLSFARVTYVPETQFGTFGESATLEFENALRMFALEEFLAGHLEGFVRSRFLGFLNDADMSALPDVAAHIAFELAASWRFVNRWSLELRGAPGIYSDIAAPQFACPATVNFHHAFSQTFAGVGGVTVRPGWDLPVMPNVGVAWEPARFFRVEAMLPRSRVMLTPFEVLTLFGTFEWRNFDFALDDEPGVPESITVNEWIATAGLAVRVTDYSHLTFEGGVFLQRELSADVAQHDTLELSKEPLFRLGWQGAF